MKKLQKQQEALVSLDLNGHYKIMQTLNEIDQLVKLISKLPGLGPKSAKRIILKLISNRDGILKPMIKALKNADINIKMNINVKNIIIEEMPEFNKYYDELYLELHKIGSRVLSVIALSLEIDKNLFSL